MSKDRESAERRRRRAKPTKARRLAPPVPAAPVDEVDRVVPEPVDAARVHGPKAERSVQDPLGDWPDTDTDRWLLDREGGGVEAPEE
jgi:hypothetical protein